jgi:hypothetical protein
VVLALCNEHRRKHGLSELETPMVTIHPTMQPVYIFMDNSNIFIPAQEIAATREDATAAREIRIQFDRLYELA